MNTVLKDLKDKCSKSVEHFKQDLGKLRGAKASTGLLENIMVDYYGSRVSIKQMGLINAPEARLITIQVYDGGAVESVEKAIRQSDLGLNPSRDGSLIRINIPPLNEERRKELIKSLHKMGEEAKIVIRNIRRDALDVLKKMEKDKAISEDDHRKGTEEVQKVVDANIKNITIATEEKEKEMLEV